jgi:hypothetical protein
MLAFNAPVEPTDAGDDSPVFVWAFPPQTWPSHSQRCGGLFIEPLRMSRHIRALAIGRRLQFGCVSSERPTMRPLEASYFWFWVTVGLTALGASHFMLRLSLLISCCPFWRAGAEGRK